MVSWLLFFYNNFYYFLFGFTFLYFIFGINNLYSAKIKVTTIYLILAVTGYIFIKFNFITSFNREYLYVLLFFLPVLAMDYYQYTYTFMKYVWVIIGLLGYLYLFINTKWTGLNSLDAATIAICILFSLATIIIYLSFDERKNVTAFVLTLIALIISIGLGLFIGLYLLPKMSVIARIFTVGLLILIIGSLSESSNSSSSTTTSSSSYSSSSSYYPQETVIEKVTIDGKEATDEGCGIWRDSDGTRWKETGNYDEVEKLDD